MLTIYKYTDTSGFVLFHYQLYHIVAVLVSLFCEVTWISAVFNIIFANKKHI